MFKNPSVTRFAFLSLLLTVFVIGTAAQQSTIIESGKFRLHKFEQPIGEETYETTREGDSLITKSNFKFVDRGSPVPLTATLRTKQNYTPEMFEIKGNTARDSTIDDAIQINGSTAQMREGTENKQAAVPAKFFTIAGYAPTVVQQAMFRYLAANKIKGSLATLPGGEVTIEKRGTDQIKVGDKTVALTRYSISGLIWGRESVWMDKQNNLIALVGVDAEFDHFESLRDGYESALATFVDKAAADGMAALAEISNRISPDKSSALVIKNANLIDGTGKPIVANAIIIVENGRIKYAGTNAAQLTLPKNAKIFDAQGKYVLPGLWDMHAHFEQVEWGPVYLAAGVTTVRDVGNEFEFITSVRDAIKEGRGLGPRILLAGIIDGDSPMALGIIRANTPDEARAVVGRYYKAGFNQIKIYSSVKPEILKEICAEAHRLGLTVTGHVPNGMNAIQAVEAGMDQINHIQYLPSVLSGEKISPQNPVPKIDFSSPEVQKKIQFFKDHNTVFDPTLSVMEMFLHSSATPYASFEPGAAKLPQELYAPINNTGLPPNRAAFGREVLDLLSKVTGEFHKDGLTIVAGTDQVVPGHSLRREIELYVQAGFTPMEAIQSATIVPARVMKMDKDSGTVETGKFADLIIVDGNPLDNISNLRNTKFVVASGRMFDCAELWKSVGFKP